MTISKKRRRRKCFPPLPDERWNFDACADAEQTHTCYLYEYSIESEAIKTEVAAVRARWDLRESPAVKRKIADWWKANPCPVAPLGSPEQREWGRKIRESIPEAIVITQLYSGLYFLCYCNHFPAKHWPGIPLEEREKIARALLESHQWLPLDHPARLEATRMFIVPMEDIVATPSHVITSLFIPQYGFSLYWERSDRKLLIDFKEWLRRTRPKDKPTFHSTKESTSRKTTDKELLKSLSALRLLRHFEGSVQRARDHCEEVLKRSLYSDESSWRKAEVKALKEIRRFNSLAG
jgi:hypothetical protein